jgi:hypothetical protein
LVDFHDKVDDCPALIDAGLAESEAVVAGGGVVNEPAAQGVNEPLPQQDADRDRGLRLGSRPGRRGRWAVSLVCSVVALGLANRHGSARPAWGWILWLTTIAALPDPRSDDARKPSSVQGHRADATSVAHETKCSVLHFCYGDLNRAKYR